MNMNLKVERTLSELAPIQQGERIQILDVLRGFALIGVLIVNMTGFAAPIFWPGYDSPSFMPWFDELAAGLIQFFAEAKFYTIFSFLFGLGFSVQFGRAAAKGKDIRSFYPRRLAVLFGIGVLHAVFLWTGDILRMYAILGFALLAFRKRSNRALLIWAGVLFVLSFAMLSVFNGQDGGNSAGIPGLDLVAMARTAYGSTSYIDVLVFQVMAALVVFVFLFFTQAPSVMALFLLGFLAGRLHIFEQIANHRRLLSRTLLLGAVLGLSGNSMFVFSDTSWIKGLGLTVGAPALAAVYVAGLAWISLHEKGAGFLAPLAQVGRMALTNYVLQSLICAVLFYGFGFGLYEKVGEAALIGITGMIYLMQILFSNIWLKRFQFGPLEWVWRSLTYGRRQPMEKKVPPQTQPGMPSPAA